MNVEEDQRQMAREAAVILYTWIKSSGTRMTPESSERPNTPPVAPVPPITIPATVAVAAGVLIGRLSTLEGPNWLGGGTKEEF